MGAEEEHVAPSSAARALASFVHARGKLRQLFPGCALYTYHDNGGVLCCAENTAQRLPRRFSIQLDCSESANLVPARGTLSTSDTLGMGRGQLVAALISPSRRAGWTHHYALQYQQDVLFGEAQRPPVHPDGLFAPFDL